MADYSSTFGGAAKDAANSTIQGSDFDTEFNNISTAIISKAEIDDVIHDTGVSGDTWTSSYSTADTVSLGTVTDGDVILLNIYTSGTKGATDGLVRVRVVKDASSTANMQFVNASHTALYDWNPPVSIAFYDMRTLMIDVTSNGTLSLDIDGISLGSDSTSCSVITSYTIIS